MSIFKLKSLIRISCPKRIALYLKIEVEAMGYTITKEDETGVELNGTMQDCMHLNLWLRTAHRVLFLIDEFEASTPDELYQNLVQTPWEEYIPANGYISITSHVLQESIKDTRFANLRVKDAVVDRLSNKTGKRPDSGPNDDRTVLFLHWKNDEAAIYFDTSGETIARHGYRKFPWKAPMQETLAAATIIATGYMGRENFVNPMCGSGTLAIEAALIACYKAPGLLRNNFGFMHIRGFDPQMWQNMRQEATRNIRRKINSKIIATDIHPQAVVAAKQNASLAGVDQFIDFKVTPFEETFLPEGGGILMMNPEYGERLGEVERLEPLYKEIGDFLKQKAQGYTGYVFTGNMDLAKNIGLKAKRRIEFYNAKIDCRLLMYELYEGSKRQPAEE